MQDNNLWRWFCTRKKWTIIPKNHDNVQTEGNASATLLLPGTHDWRNHYRLRSINQTIWQKGPITGSHISGQFKEVLFDLSLESFPASSSTGSSYSSTSNPMLITAGHTWWDSSHEHARAIRIWEVDLKNILNTQCIYSFNPGHDVYRVAKRRDLIVSASRTLIDKDHSGGLLKIFKLPASHTAKHKKSANVVQVFDTTLEPLATFEQSGHTSGVQCICLGKDQLVSGGEDYCIKVWDVENATCVLTIGDGAVTSSPVLQKTSKKKKKSAKPKNGQKQISCVDVRFNEGLLISGSWDGSARLYDIRSSAGKCVQKYESHSRAVNCLQWRGNILMTGADDGVVKVWEVRKGLVLETIETKKSDHSSSNAASSPPKQQRKDNTKWGYGMCNVVKQLYFDDAKIILGTVKGAARIYDPQTFKEVRRVTQVQSRDDNSGDVAMPNLADLGGNNSMAVGEDLLIQASESSHKQVLKLWSFNDEHNDLQRAKKKKRSFKMWKRNKDGKV